MIEIEKYSYCGFKCENCPLFYKKQRKHNKYNIKNINNITTINFTINNNLKNNLKNSLNDTLKHNTINTICYGCKNDSEIKFHKDCNIALCAEKRGISFCGLCPDFPCVFYSNFTTEAIDKIYEIKRKITEKNIT